MGKPKNARNVKAGDSVILKRRKGKNLIDSNISLHGEDPDIIFLNRRREKSPIILNAFHESEDPSKILKVIDVDYRGKIPTARVKVKSKNNNPWNEGFWQILALEDLLKV